MSGTKLEKLTAPITIGNVFVKNRLWQAPTCTKMPGVDGSVTQQVLDNYTTLAQGGVGLIIVEAAAIHPQHIGFPHQLRIDHDNYLAGLKRLYDQIHWNDCKVSQQIHGGGMYSMVARPKGPSVASYPGLDGHIYHAEAMTVEEIDELIEAFGQAAFRAKMAGADMVEIHGGTGYVVGQFYSPNVNKRTDAWGGSFENRIRFPLECLKRCKELCGPDFPVAMRIIGSERIPGGWTNEEAVQLAQALERNGAGYISVTTFTYATFPLGEGYFSPRTPKNKEALILPLVKPIMDAVHAPVIVNGNLVDPKVMEEVLEEKYADVIALARPLFCDPELPRKAFAGQFEDIRTCIRCSHCLWSFVQNFQVECVYNPELGRERQFALARTDSPKRVLIIGGGPGGLEAARVAALRGHTVTLWEKEKRLGGQVNLASLPPGKGDYRVHVIGWLSRQCTKAGVELQTATEGTVDKVKEYNPDVVIVATGAALDVMPDIPGVEKEHVYNSYDVLMGKAKPAGKRVIVSRGMRDGAEMAEILTRRGHEVTLIEHEKQIGGDMNFWAYMYLIQKLMELGVKIMTQSRITRILDDGVLVVDNHLREHKLEADAVVLAWGRAPERKLADMLEGVVPSLYRIGDCVSPREIVDAVKEGAYIAREI